MPFVKVTLTAPKPRDFATNPQTLGEHLKKRRRELGLYQTEAALRLKVNEWTYCTWEIDRAEPVISMFPKIINFLGYYPYPAPQTIGEKLLAHRRQFGLSRERLAEMIGADEGTILRLERGHKCPRGICGRRIKDFLMTLTEIANPHVS